MGYETVKCYCNWMPWQYMQHHYI